MINFLIREFVAIIIEFDCQNIIVFHIEAKN